MKEPAPYKCDYCEQRKGTTNHWWMRDISAGQEGEFRLVRWDSAEADGAYGPGEGVPLFEHICSESCASKALSQHMARVGDQKIAEALRIEAVAGAAVAI